MPFPSYQFVILGILRTIILLVVALTLNRVVVAVFTCLRDSRDRAFETVSKIENASKFVLFPVCLLFVLAIWKIDLTPLLASAGIAGIAIAIAAKDALSNLIGNIRGQPKDLQVSRTPGVLPGIRRFRTGAGTAVLGQTAQGPRDRRASNGQSHLQKVSGKKYHYSFSPTRCPSAPIGMPADWA